MRVVWAEEDTAAALHQQYRTEKVTEVRTRLHALWLLRQGRGPTAVAAAVGVGRNAVQRWLRWYREGGLDAVRSRRRGGPGKPSFLTKDQEQQVVAAAATGVFATAQEMRDWIEEQFGVVYTRDSMYTLLPRLGIRLKVPRPPGQSHSNTTVVKSFGRLPGSVFIPHPGNAMSDLAPPPSPEALASETLATWPDHLGAVAKRLQAVFPFRKTHRRAVAYIEELLGPTARKNSWQLAEARGEAHPYGFQHLLGRAVWSPDAARDALRAYVGDHLGDPQGVLIVDETEFLKKGTHSAGVGRQYTRTEGRIENCQVGVFVAYAGPRGYTLVDRELFLPRAWTDDPERLQAVGLAPDAPFASKPQRAQRMLARVLDAGLPAAWVTGDSIYGHAADLRRSLEDRGQAYVLAVPSHEPVWQDRQWQEVRALYATLAEVDWQRRSAGAGSKGERGYDWQCWILAEPEDADWDHYLLFRRSVTDAEDWQAYVAFAPQGCDLETLVAVAARRWAIEHVFEAAKQETGLDDYEVRSAHGWYRHVTLALWALALLAVMCAADLDRPPPPKKKSPPTHSLAAFKRARGLAGG